MKMWRNFLTVTLLLCFCQLLYAFENKYTHPALTKEAVNNATSQIDNYLKTQLGLSSGLSTNLYWNFPQDIKSRIKLGGADQDKTTRSILEWLMAGSNIEDMDGVRRYSWRPRHHFYDPTRNAGLDNHTDNPDWDAPFWSGWLPLGESALDWAIDGHSSYDPYNNHDKWTTTRNLFYHSLTEPNKAAREAYLAESLMKLGCLLHLLEDMGVPAHTRNDFLFAHFRSTVASGNPLEGWIEEKVKNNGGNILSSFLAGWTPAPQVYNKVSNYFDTDIYTGNYLGDDVPTPDNWGLSERTNYQFLSYSTVFRADDGTKYYFPHPDPCNTSPHIDSSLWYKRRYKSGYGITHLARTNFTEKYVVEKYDPNRAYGPASHWPYRTEAVPYDTTFDKAVHEDYAEITIPRTINYATGLVNYFFRGRLSVEAECIECDVFELTITNKSSNSGTPQTLKGGDFELYWEDGTGNRAQVTEFGIDGGWTSSSTLAYDEDITAAFTKPTAGEPVKYILVYRGNICENPAAPDPDDEIAIAVAVFTPPSDDCCYSCTCAGMVTPDYTCDGHWCVNGGYPQGSASFPDKITISIDNVQRCSDDFIIEDLDGKSYCLTIHDPLGYNHCHDVQWIGSTPDGYNITVGVLPWEMGEPDHYGVLISKGTEYYFVRDNEHSMPCFPYTFSNSSQSSDCNSSWIYQGETWGYIKGYGGSVNIFYTGSPDAPEPNPMTWATEPEYLHPCSIRLTATAVITGCMSVEYYFECINDSSKNSGWQTNRIYTVSGLDTDTYYTFRVKARNKDTLNETGWSSASAPLMSCCADPPTPNPAQWASTPLSYNDGTFYYHTMTAVEATSDNPPVYYRFECTYGAGTSSNWQLSPTYNAGPYLVPNYSVYRVYTKDSNGCTGSPSPKYDTNGQWVP